jgi:hypothetical protein
MTARLLTPPILFVALFAVTWIPVREGLPQEVPAKTSQGIGTEPEQLSPEIVKAWEEAGAELARIYIDESGILFFNSSDAHETELPGFVLRGKTKVSQLPAPNSPFGLICFGDSNDNMPTIGSFEHLRVLRLSTNHEKNSLKELARLKKLQALYLSGTNVTDSDLASLSDLNLLQHMDLSATSITDDGLAHISKLQQLQTLRLRRANVSDVCLKNIADIKYKVPKISRFERYSCYGSPLDRVITSQTT